METPVRLIETLLERIEAFTKTSIELSKLQALRAFAAVATSFTSKMIVWISLSLGVITASIGLALWLGELMGKVYIGLFMVAGMYLLLGLIFHQFLHRWIRKPMSSMIISKALEPTES